MKKVRIIEYFGADNKESSFVVENFNAFIEKRKCTYKRCGLHLFSRYEFKGSGEINFLAPEGCNCDHSVIIKFEEINTLRKITIIDIQEDKVLASMQTEDVLYWVSFLKAWFIITADRNIEDFKKSASTFYVTNDIGKRLYKVLVE